MSALIFDDIRVLAERLKGSAFDLHEALRAHGIQQCPSCMVWYPAEHFGELGERCTVCEEEEAPTPEKIRATL